MAVTTAIWIAVRCRDRFERRVHSRLHHLPRNVIEIAERVSAP
jgi:hypothetical protein